MSATAQTFRRIYLSNGWHSKESRSGTGSTLAETEVVRSVLPELISKCWIKTILDVPCGDFNWMRHVDLAGVTYHGADIVPEIVQENQRAHGCAGRTFSVMNIIEDALPAADLIICRDCLCHFSHEDANRAIQNIRNSGSRYLLANFYDRHYTNLGHGNLAIQTGQWFPINLQSAPFRFPRPMQQWNEKCPTEGYTDKTLGLWLVADLPWKLTP